jgi:putative ABC transport system permease protein
VSWLHLIWRNLLRRKARSLFTLLSILVAFVLFCYLSAIDVAFGLGVEVTGENRLLAINKISLIQPLPVAYEGRIEAVEGVSGAAHCTWFGGKYQNEENAFAVFPVDPEDYLPLFPEFVVPDEQRRAWFENRVGALVGRHTAERFGFEVGDRVPIQGTIWRTSAGDTWEFEIEGIYHGAEKGVDETLFLFHYDYFNEARSYGRDLVGWYVIQVADPAQAETISKRVDERFQNSFYETETMPEKAFVQNFANQIGDIGLILRLVMLAVFFTILLVAANTMAQSVRERTNELGVLKTLGFSDRAILVSVLVESLLLAGLGGGIGMAMGWALVTAGGDPTRGYLPLFYVPAVNLAIGAAIVVLLGLASGAIPAVGAMRLKIVDALRRV